MSGPRIHDEAPLAAEEGSIRAPMPVELTRSRPLRVGLRDYLLARLGPLSVFLFAVISIAAPLAYHIMGTATVRANAAASARQVAVAIRDEAELRPLLWRYAAERIMEYRAAHEAEPSIVHIELIDEQGRRIDVGEDRAGPDAELLWARSEVKINEDHVADVWVGATTAEIEAQAFRLLLAFAGLGLMLAGLTYWIPSRAMDDAEGHIVALIGRLEDSQRALAELNTSLEGQVEVRSQQLARALSEIRTLSSRAVTVQEAERRAISRELHDSAGQTLTAVRLHLQLIAQLSEAQSQAPLDMVHDKSTKAMQVLDGALEEIRRVVHRLAPVVLDDVGLAAGVQRLCEDAEARSDFLVHHDITVPESLGSGLDIACYRLVQEALTNITRHAQAGEVNLALHSDADSVRIEIDDDGVGFDLEEVLQKGRRGLRGMRERVELLGGRMEIDSRPGAGARFVIELPRDQEDEVSGVAAP